MVAVTTTTMVLHRTIGFSPNNPVINGPRPVDPIPSFSLPGGGIEYFTHDLVHVKIIQIWELMK